MSLYLTGSQAATAAASTHN